MPPHPVQPSHGYRGDLPANIDKPMTWFVIRRWKRTIITAGILGILAGVLASVLISARYQVTARLEIQDLNADFLNMKQVMPVNDDTLTATTAMSDVQTQIQLLQSDTLLDRVVSEVLASEVKAGKDKEKTLKELKGLRKKLKVRGIEQTRVIEMSVRSAHPEFASVFLNRIAADAIDRNVAARLDMSQSIGQWLSHLVQGAEQRLRASETALQDYARSHNLLFTSDNKNIADESLRQIQDEFSKSTAERIEKQSRYEASKSSPASAIPGVLDDSSLKQYEDQLTDLKRQRADLAAVYTPDYAKVKRLDAQIASVEAALNREQQDVVQRIQNDYEKARRQQALASAAYNVQKQNMSDLAQRTIQYDVLQHEVDSNRQVYDSMLQQVRQATIASAMHPSNIRVVDSAFWKPDEPVWPQPILACAFGLSLFSFGAILFAFSRERSDSTLKEPGDGSFFLNMPELGVILHMPQNGNLVHAGDGDNSKGKALAPRRFKIGKSPSPKEQAFLVAESFRSIATSILFSGGDGTTPHVIVVASAEPEDGKTTVVANVGAALARSGRRVLLVEGDLRRNRLDRVFKLPNDVGLSTLLRDESLAERNIKAAIRETSEPGLFVLTSGPCRSDTPELLHSQALRDLIERLRRTYDVILIDTPPLLEIPDARLVSRIADGVLFIARARRTTVESAASATQRLAFDKAPVLGLVLNDWNPKQSRYYSRYGQYVSSN
ncbi:MAG: polysaccharide biosynthesis tyrosine autokinase [Acidobacteriaceae bacterium]|nr:polysaccharide biosynthesis tyrosine autokinase [Acidobacteriaceae bacterium]